MSSRFELRPRDVNVVRECVKSTGLPYFIVSTCVARGFNTPKKIDEFLNPTLKRCWTNPFDIPGLPEIAERLHDAIIKKKKICVFGDFDVDGITSTAVMTRAIRALGGRAYPFIPNRFEEGYGISLEAYSKIKEKCEPEVMVSVDCGIANESEVSQISSQGVEVLITDHHEAGDLVPKGVLICDPKFKGSEEDARLAGVGVALKVVQALGSIEGFPNLWLNYLDLAALGTLADMMEMGFQNRSLVAAGLERMQQKTRPAIAALCEVAGTSPKDVTSTSVGFSIIPKINASGRLGQANVALNLLLTDKEDEAKELAKELEVLNQKRKSLESELGDCASEQAKEKWHDQSCLIVAGEGWHEGVKGIVAAKLIDTYRVPTLLFTIDGDEARGSGRSVGEVNLFEAVDAQRDLLTRYGGHKSAVGVTLPTKNLPEFERRMTQYLDKIDHEDLKKKILIDSVVSLDELTLDNVSLIKKIGPFGQGNTQPIFLAKNIREIEGRPVGASEEHYYCKLSNSKSKISCINFHCENVDELKSYTEGINAVFSVKNETWRGVTNVKAQAVSLLPTKNSSELTSLTSDPPLELIDGLFSYPKYIPSKFQNNETLDLESRKENREKLKSLGENELSKKIKESLIGQSSPHESQSQVIENLKRGKNTLAIMATGRGKSFIFQFFATYLAITQNKSSIFIYPLRALMADQAFSMQKNLRDFQITCEILNGNTTSEDRKRIYKGLKEKNVDIVLTTPEYLKFHSSEIAECKNIGFVVVDEAHHTAEGLTGRKDYLNLTNVLAQLDNPIVLATSATMPDEVSIKTREVLGINNEVVDKTPRNNLKINDKRNISPKEREDYIAKIISDGQKAVIYVSTRQQCMDVARRLRLRVPKLAASIGFYCAGLKKEDRAKIEDYFRSGELNVLVATSAFGEGIDIPNIRNIVLYHMPFSFLEFNQMAGRAGRNGEESWIHLLFGDRDAMTNRQILNEATPPRDIMAVIYNHLKKLQEKSVEPTFSTNAKSFSKSLGGFRIKGVKHVIKEQEFECAVNVFADLGLIFDDIELDNNRKQHKIRINEDAKRVELTDSLRYLEGQIQKDDFESFKDEIMRMTQQELTNRVTHPIF